MVFHRTFDWNNKEIFSDSRTSSKNRRASASRRLRDANSLSESNLCSSNIHCSPVLNTGNRLLKWIDDYPCFKLDWSLTIIQFWRTHEIPPLYLFVIANKHSRFVWALTVAPQWIIYGRFGLNRFWRLTGFLNDVIVRYCWYHVHLYTIVSFYVVFLQSFPRSHIFIRTNDITEKILYFCVHQLLLSEQLTDERGRIQRNVSRKW